MHGMWYDFKIPCYKGGIMIKNKMSWGGLNSVNRICQTTLYRYFVYGSMKLIVLWFVTQVGYASHGFFVLSTSI